MTTFTCAYCHGAYDSPRSDSEAHAEYDAMRSQYDAGAKRDPEYDPAQTAVICDDCFAKMAEYYGWNIKFE